MIPLSFRLEAAGLIDHLAGSSSPWRSFGNTLITYISGGDYRIEVLGKTKNDFFLIPNKTAFMIPPACRHRVSVPGQLTLTARYTHLHCRAYELQGLFTNLNQPVLFQGEDATLIKECHTKLMQCKNFTSLLQASVATAQELAKLVTLVAAQCPALEQSWAEPQRVRLLPVLKYIQDQISNPISRKDLAEVAHLSIPHLHTLFTQAFQTAPMDFVHHERIQHARQLLHWSDLSISEVARHCGFEDQYYFSRAFKRAEGVPPSHYRKTIRSYH